MTDAACFARPLPAPHPREGGLFAYFDRLARASERFRSLAVQRDAAKGRFLAADRDYQVGDVIFDEATVLSVSDDVRVCLACGVRHDSKTCASWKRFFATMKSALAGVDTIADQSGYPASRIREVIKFIAISYAEVFAPVRGGGAATEAERKAASDVWLILGLDDGSQIVEQDGTPTTYTVTPRASDPDRTMAAQLIHSALPLTYRKHYPIAIIENVINVLDLNAHETVESVYSGDSSSSAAAADLADVDGTSGDAVFPFFAMIEHSCAENCCWTITGNKMQITALKAIRAGANDESDASVMNFDYRTALVRGLSSSFEQSLQMQPPEVPIDVALAERQHEEYISVLRSLLPNVIEVAPDARYADCNFIEDCGLLLGSTCVLSHPGAPTRVGEVEAVAEALAGMPFARTFRITAPATLDGGDVLFTGRHLFVGQSKRTNAAALQQLQEYFHAGGAGAPCSFRVHGVPVTAGLHLKSVMSILADGVIVIGVDSPSRAIEDTIRSIDASYQFIRVPDISAANVLRVRQTMVIQRGFPSSETILRAAAESHGLDVVTLDMSELIKADGALTCGSLLSTVATTNHTGAKGALTPLSINYAPAFLPTNKRREYLQTSYGFRCVCALCEGRLPDRSRAFRCTQPVDAGAVCSGTVSPYGDASDSGRWSCATCRVAPSVEVVRQYLSAEQDALSVLRRRGDAAAIAPDELLDALQDDPSLVQLVRAEMEQIVDVALAPTSTAAAATSSSASPAVAAVASAAAQPVPSSFAVSPSLAKTARKHARQRKKASIAETRAAANAGSLSVAPALALPTETRQSIPRLAPTHHIVHRLLEHLVQMSITHATALSPADAAPIWTRAFSYARARLHAIGEVCGEHHWSLAREHDRLAAMLVLSGQPSAAVEHWRAAYETHRLLFGDAADSTRRAKVRLDSPPQTAQQL